MCQSSSTSFLWSSITFLPHVFNIVSKLSSIGQQYQVILFSTRLLRLCHPGRLRNLMSFVVVCLFLSLCLFWTWKKCLWIFFFFFKAEELFQNLVLSVWMFIHSACNGVVHLLMSTDSFSLIFIVLFQEGEILQAQGDGLKLGFPPQPNRR